MRSLLLDGRERGSGLARREVGHRSDVSNDGGVVRNESVRWEVEEVHRGNEDGDGLIEESSSSIRVNLSTCSLVKERGESRRDLDLLSDGSHGSKDGLRIARRGLRSESSLLLRSGLLLTSPLDSLGKLLRFRRERSLRRCVRIGVLGILGT